MTDSRKMILNAAVAAYALLGPTVGATAAPGDMTVAEVVKATKLSIGEIIASTPYRTADGKQAVRVGSGTGFVVDASGDLVTNCHVVSAPDDVTVLGPTKIEVRFSDNEQVRLPARVRGCDAVGDIAVVHVDGLNPARKALAFADMHGVDVGQDVITIGFAEGLEGDATVARGVVSALHRSFAGGQFSDLVQTDATINHGNSGGPLLDLKGEVVGVNTYTTASVIKLGDIAAATRAGNKPDPEQVIPVESMGLGIYYARSAATASWFAHQIIALGDVPRPDLGWTVGTLDPDKIQLPERGVGVNQVKSGRAAAAIGLKANDIVTFVEWADGSTYHTPDAGSLHNALAMIEPGQTVKFHFYRLTEAGFRAAADFDPVAEAEIGRFFASYTAPRLDPNGSDDTLSKMINHMRS